MTAKSTTVYGGDLNDKGPLFAIDNIIGPKYSDAKTFMSTRNMKAPWIEIELSEMVTISGVEVTPVRTSQRYFLSVHIRGGASSLSAQQDERKMSVDTSQTFFAKYLGPHVKTGETIFDSLNLPFAAKFVSFQSELTSMGKSLSINEVRFLQGTIPSSLCIHFET